MGISSSKQKTENKVNQTETGSSTPVVPEWAQGLYERYGDQLGSFTQADPTSFVAGASPLQQGAWNNAGQLDNWKQPAMRSSDFATAGGSAGPFLAGSPQQALGDGAYAPDRNNPFPLPAGSQPGKAPVDRSTNLRLPDYSPPPQQPGYAMPRTGQPFGNPNPALTGASQAGAYSNPYDQQVVDTTLQGYDRNAGQQRAIMQAAGARNGAFGGSRFGLAEGQFDADTALGRAGLEGGLRQQGFNTANQFGMQDAASGNNMLQFNANQQDEAAQRQLQAGAMFGGLSDSIGANTRADLGTMAGLGDQQRGIEQQFATSPLAQLEMESQLLDPLSVLLGRNVTGNTTGTNTSTTTGRPSLFSQMLQLGQAGAQAYAGGMGGY